LSYKMYSKYTLIYKYIDVYIYIRFIFSFIDNVSIVINAI